MALKDIFSIFNKTAPIKNALQQSSLMQLQEMKNEPAPVVDVKKQWIPTQLIRQESVDAKRWFSALRMAENIVNPTRYNLLMIYNDCITYDPHLFSLISTRKNKVLSKEFKVVDKEGNELFDKTELLKHSWFFNFMDLALDSTYFGHSLIQFSDIVDGNFTEVELVQRQHVRPEFQIIVDTYAQFTGTNYNDPNNAISEWVIECVYKNRHELGLLNKVCPYVLYKKLAIQAWAELTSRFGVPLRIGKTANILDESLRNNMQNMLQNMGNSTWGLFAEGDEIEIIETKVKNGEMFETLLRYIDEQISKLVLGGTMVSDNGSSRSQSEVHERTAEEYCSADLQFITRLVNDKLLPLMSFHGLGFENLFFQFDNTEKVTIDEQFAFDSKLLDYYDIPTNYILQKYGTPVEAKAQPAQFKQEIASEDELKNYSPLNFLKPQRL